MTTILTQTPIVSNFASGGTAPGTFRFKGGACYLLVQGTIGSATLQLQIKGPAGTFMNIGSAINAVGSTLLNLPPGEYQPVMGGSGGSGIYASLLPAA